MSRLDPEFGIKMMEILNLCRTYYTLTVKKLPHTPVDCFVRDLSIQL